MIGRIQQMCNESWSGIYITTSIQGFSHTGWKCDHGQIARLSELIFLILKEE